MKIKRIKFQNYTVFEDQQMEFSPGINVIIGENGTGKTHLMKALYSACQSADKKTSFSHKLVMTMLPDVALDITDKNAVEKVITEVNPDAVIHCAAWTAVDMAEDDDKVKKFEHGLISWF